jgi:hypothetical protein
MASKREGSISLKRFARCAVTLREILHNDSMLSEQEFRFIDNHFQVLEMAYLRWKQRQTPHQSSIDSEMENAKTA